jgi:polysaccharide export outer membrane protein
MSRFVFPGAHAPHWVSWLAVLAGALAAFATPAHAQYKLQPGDALEVSVAGAPELRQRAVIGLDGKIALPLSGPLAVTGLSVQQARVKITDALANKEFRQSVAGRDTSHLIQGDEIVVSVAEYRPIYVSGDVIRPGEYTFRPGMSVRQAVALAGGYGRVQTGAANMVLQSADFQSEYQSLWVDYATEQARIWRLKKELGLGDTKYTADQAPVPASFSRTLKEITNEQLAARTANRSRDKALLQDAIRNADTQIGVLNEKKLKDEEGNQADAADYATVRALFQKGLTPSTRLSDARRAALFSANQLLQTIVEISNIQRQRSDYALQLERVDSQYRMDAWRELEASDTRLAQIAARLKAAGQKLEYVGLTAAHDAQGLGTHVTITVHRRSDAGLETLPANADLELAPGDVVDVKMQADGLTAAIDAPAKATP